MEWKQRLRDDLDRLANDHVNRADPERGYDRRITPAELRVRRALRHLYFIPNRRACWAYVQAVAPTDVKKVIWHHERDELIDDPRIGKGHVDVDRIEDIEPVPAPPGVRVAIYGWLYIAMHRPWLQGLASSHILERINDPTIIKGKTLIQRSAERLMKDLNLKLEELPLGTRVHLEADIEHSNLIWSVFERYVADEIAYREVLDGARESLECQALYDQAVTEAVAMANQEAQAG
jgi:hypothetical protein